MAADPQITEDRLNALREEAARTGQLGDRGIVPSGSPFLKPAPSAGYSGNPVLKPPTWTWQVPLYFFVGGVAGVSAIIALVADAIGNAGVVRVELWVAFAGALVSAPLLIADLGRPARFLNMLRVFKLRSAMSLGAWTLVGFSSAAGLAVVCHELMLGGYGNSFVHLVEWLAETLAACAGLMLASYTSVLLGVTAIPIWSENRKLLPAVFLTGALGSASAILEMVGFLVPATQFIGIVASAVETAVAIIIEFRRRNVDRPLREGVVGWLTRAGTAIAGPTSLLLRIFWGHTVGVRYLAAASFVAGALIARYAWIAAGRVSARDPQVLFQVQRSERGAMPTAEIS
jgi:hypothetical protein